MANETKIGELIVELKLKAEAMEKGIESVKNQLKNVETQTKKTEANNEKLSQSYIAMSAVAVGALIGIGKAVSTGISEYNKYIQAVTGLREVAKYTGQDMEKLGTIMSKYNSILTQTDLSGTIKNFSLMGFTAEQTDQMIQALTESAIRNRNANYTVSEAVKIASDGYKQGISTLSDSAGVTENLSVMLDKYAQSIGKTAAKLSEAEINQAYLTRTMEAAKPFAGAMSEYNESLAGSQGKWNQALKESQVQLGEALAPILTDFLNKGTEAIKVVNKWTKEHKDLSTAIIIGVGAIASIIAIAKTATVVFGLLSVAVGGVPFLAFAAAAGVAAGGLYLLDKAMDQSVSKLKKVNETFKNAQDALKGGINDVNEAVTVQESVDDMEKIINNYENIAKRRQELVNQSKGKISYTIAETRELNLLAQKEKELNKLFEKSGHTLESYKVTLASLKQQLQEFSVKDVKVEDTNIDKPYVPSTGTYQNKALDEYKKTIDYKRQLNKITAEEEIKGYEHALSKLAKTTEEKQDLEIKIYQLRKALSEDLVSKENEILTTRNKASEQWIETQIKLGNLNEKEQLKAYDRIIKYHKEHLDKILSDTRINASEKEKVWQEETAKIQEHLMKQRDLQIDSFNKLHTQLSNALQKEAEKDKSIALSNLQYDLKILQTKENAEIASINKIYDAKVASLQAELDALDAAEKAKSRLEETTDYEKKKARLEDLVAFENDALTKLNYQKELDKLNSDWNKKQSENLLSDKKELLNTEIENLKTEQQIKLENISAQYNLQKEQYNQLIESTNQYYDNQISKASETAEKLVANSNENQNRILTLLESFGNKYEITGTTLGQKLVDGFKNKVSEIETVINNLQSKISSSLNDAVSSKVNNIALAGNSNSSETGSIKSINQIINFNGNVDTPSQVAKKVETVARQLIDL